MSTGGGDSRRRTTRATVIFILLLVLGVIWPQPVVFINSVTFDADLPIHEKSFLGREAPQWDVPYWMITGLLTILLIRGGNQPISPALRLFREDLRGIGGRLLVTLRAIRGLRFPGALAVGVVTTALTWIFLDTWLLASLDFLRTGAPRILARYLNRLGGGMNPAMVIGYLTLAGIAFTRPRWWRYAMAMAMGGIAAGVFVQLLKLIVHRARPELWLGPGVFIESTSSSFPSGHAVGAFALAGVLVFGSPSRSVRTAAFLLASAIAISRVIVFRHWPSDVVAAAFIGLSAAWLATRALVNCEDDVAENGHR